VEMILGASQFLSSRGATAQWEPWVSTQRAVTEGGAGDPPAPPGDSPGGVVV